MPAPNVDTDEHLYRQIGPGGDPLYYEPGRNPTVHQAAFLPTSKDSGGLSLIRGRFRTEIWSAYRLERPNERFRLAVLNAHDLGQLALNEGFEVLNYRSTADGLDNRFGEPWAHCEVKEINRAEYDRDKAVRTRIKNWAMKVVEQVTNDKLSGPFELPTDDDPYRPGE